jgi:hypothetical protein
MNNQGPIVEIADEMTDEMTDEQANILKVVFANNISAMKISKILSEHSNNILLTDYIVTGLIYRLMIPMTDDEMTQSINEAESILYASSSDEEEDTTDADTLDDAETVDEDLNTKRKIKYNSCNCDICNKCRVCLINFGEFIPNDHLSTIYKNSIVETCEKHNLIL